jgi:hypothetical protein
MTNTTATTTNHIHKRDAHAMMQQVAARFNMRIDLIETIQMFVTSCKGAGNTRLPEYITATTTADLIAFLLERQGWSPNTAEWAMVRTELESDETMRFDSIGLSIWFHNHDTLAVRFDGMRSPAMATVRSKFWAYGVTEVRDYTAAD